MPVVTPQAVIPQTPAVNGHIPAPKPVVPAVEASAVEAPKVEEALSPKFAALARKEKELRQLQQAIKAEREALKSKESDYETNYIPKARLKSELFKVLEESGVSHDELANFVLQGSQPKDPYLAQLEAKIAALEGKVKEPMDKIQEQEKRQYEQAVSQIRTEAKLLVDSDPAYETIKEMGATEAVVELIKKTFDSSGELLTVESASKQVEEYLLEEAMKMASLNKIKQRLAPAVEVAPQVPQKSQQITTQLKTLTNAQASSSSSSLSAREKRERAILAFKGQLNT